MASLHSRSTNVSVMIVGWAHPEFLFTVNTRAILLCNSEKLPIRTKIIIKCRQDSHMLFISLNVFTPLRYLLTDFCNQCLRCIFDVTWITKLFITAFSEFKFIDLFFDPITSSFLIKPLRGMATVILAINCCVDGGKSADSRVRNPLQISFG